MTTALIPISKVREPILRRMFELYAYDFSEYNGRDLDEFGSYSAADLDLYWIEPGRRPFFIYADGRPAGFALVSSHCYLRKEPGARVVSEFFVLRKYRRKGVGTEAARQLFDRFPGLWEVNQHGKNLPSIAFWEKVVSAYTGTDFTTGSYIDDGIAYRSLQFDNSSAARPVSIRLSEVTKKDFWPVCELEVNEEQRYFVAPNAYSLAEAKYEDCRRPYAVYNGGLLVGFGMLATDPKDARHWILRFMIDRRYQHMGLGREAFRQLLALAEQGAEGAPIYLSAEPENEVARRLYRGFGFTDTQERCRNEIVMVRTAVE